MATKYTQDPDAVLDYQVDWSDWLPEGDTIIASTMTAAGPGATVDSYTHTDTVATVWVSNVVLGETTNVVNHIVTAGGREDDRTLIFTGKEK